MSKRVLFFILDGIGGAERVMVNLAKILSADGFNIHFVIIHKGSYSRQSIAKLIKDDFPYSWINYKGQLSFMRDLYVAIKKFDPDIVFASAMHINQRLLFMSPLFLKTKFIVRNDNYLYTLPKYKQLTLKYTYRLADRIIGQTKEMGEELIKIELDPKKIKVIKNPIDADLIEQKIKEPNPFVEYKEKKIFMGCGRLSFQKGFDLLVQAFAIVNNKIPNSLLFILGNTDYGEGKVYHQLLNLVKEHDLQNNVFFTGHVDNPYKYIKNADVFVLSSRWEGLPNVLLESEYIGTPMAAFRCIPVIERMIKEGCTGYTAQAENIESLAEAMIKCSSLGHYKNNDTSADSKEWLAAFTF